MKTFLYIIASTLLITWMMEFMVYDESVIWIHFLLLLALLVILYNASLPRHRL